MKENNEDFKYKYVAPTNSERKEIESIRNNYIDKPTTNKLTELRKLDSKVRNIPTLISLIVGIIGTLTFGLGLSMILEWNLKLWGLIPSIIGVILIAIAYPIYSTTHKKLKIKYSDKIIKLSNELLNDERN